METESSLERERSRSVISELGLIVERDVDDLVSRASVFEGMNIPGTDTLRLSVVAAWADTVLGVLAMKNIVPAVPATVQLDVHLVRPISGRSVIVSRARPIKIGKTISEFVMDFSDESGTELGYGHALFMATPNPQFSLPVGDWVFKGFAKPWPGLTRPIAERIGCERNAPGTATLPWAVDLQNATKAINGGLLAVLVEEAVLSAVPAGQSLSSMTITYQRSIRTGPAVAHAKASEHMGRVEVIDAAKNELAAYATVQLFSS